MTIKARVTAGRLVLNEPTDLPDGTEVELLPLDPGDWLDAEDRAALHKALRNSDADVAAGRLVDAEEVAYTRATYTNISETQFTWRGEKSDDGKEWSEFMVIEAYRHQE